MNKLMQVSRYSLDDLSGIEIVERPIPQPSAGEVLVRVNLRPINPAGEQSRCNIHLLCTYSVRGTSMARRQSACGISRACCGAEWVPGRSSACVITPVRGCKTVVPFCGVQSVCWWLISPMEIVHAPLGTWFCLCGIACVITCRQMCSVP